MASKYAKPMQIPANFPDVLRDFTREVLRQQGKVETKEAIYAFGCQYFKELVAKQSGANKTVDEVAMSAPVPPEPQESVQVEEEEEEATKEEEEKATNEEEEATKEEEQINLDGN